MAEANKDNLDLILQAWKNVHPSKGRDLEQKIKAESDIHKKVEMIWLDICTSSKNSKCEFMEEVLATIEEDNINIKCPLYIENAIKHVIGDNGTK